MSKIENIKKLQKEKGVQFRNFNYETRAEEDNYKIEGKPVVFEQPTFLFEDGDGWACFEVIDRGALDDADMDDVIFNYNHAGRVYARTRNGSLDLYPTEDGLNMTATLWKDDPGHTELYKDISRGNIDKMSFAFTIAESKWEEVEAKKMALRRITKIGRLFDVSAVDIPAYNDTQISARDDLRTEREQILTERKEAASRKAELEERKAKLKSHIAEIIGGEKWKKD